MFLITKTLIIKRAAEGWPVFNGLSWFFFPTDWFGGPKYSMCFSLQEKRFDKKARFISTDLGKMWIIHIYVQVYGRDITQLNEN